MPSSESTVRRCRRGWPDEDRPAERVSRSSCRRRHWPSSGTSTRRSRSAAPPIPDPGDGRGASTECRQREQGQRVAGNRQVCGGGHRHGEGENGERKFGPVAPHEHVNRRSPADRDRRNVDRELDALADVAFRVGIVADRVGYPTPRHGRSPAPPLGLGVRPRQRIAGDSPKVQLRPAIRSGSSRHRCWGRR